MKFLSIFLLLFIHSNASIINFEEEKYISAIDDTLHKKGTLEFKNQSIKLKYNNSNRVLIYNDDTLTLKNGNEIQQIDLETQLPLKMVFLLIESIHTNNLENLEEFFIIEKNETIILKPKGSLKSYIKQVEFKKGKRLEFLSIQMNNQDKTIIREIDE